MSILAQFLFRLAFGLTAAMACTSPRLVTCGFFKVHLWVVLGFNTLAVLIALSVPEFAVWPPLAAGILSYFAAIVWAIELPRLGRGLLIAIAAIDLFGAFQAATATATSADMDAVALLAWADALTAGLVLGTTMAAMLLGHWYLNTPTMRLEPLERLILLMAAAIVLRALVCSGSLALQAASPEGVTGSLVLWLSMRWLWGIAAVLALAWLAWQTLKIPNTQSATGILYVAVIAAFLGELSSQLLSGQALYAV